MRTICIIAHQLINGIRIIHKKGILHRDIKPNNICLGYGQSDPSTSPIYLIDFGLVKEYMTREGNHIPLIEGKGLVGTNRFCSIFTHEGYE
jgi:serine/threonine protein kinase